MSSEGTPVPESTWLGSIGESRSTSPEREGVKALKETSIRPRSPLASFTPEAELKSSNHPTSSGV
jgi:hypothetical protein